MISSADPRITVWDITHVNRMEAKVVFQTGAELTARCVHMAYICIDIGYNYILAVILFTEDTINFSALILTVLQL